MWKIADILMLSLRNGQKWPHRGGFLKPKWARIDLLASKMAVDVRSGIRMWPQTAWLSVWGWWWCGQNGSIICYITALSLQTLQIGPSTAPVSVHFNILPPTDAHFLHLHLWTYTLLERCAFRQTCMCNREKNESYFSASTKFSHQDLPV